MTSAFVEESPYDLLQRAARHVFWLAAHFKAYVDLALDNPELSGTHQEWWASDTINRNASGEARRWAQTMNPSIAVWLGTAFQYEAHRIGKDKGWTDLTTNPLRDLAYAVLGERAT